MRKEGFNLFTDHKIMVYNFKYKYMKIKYSGLNCAADFFFCVTVWFLWFVWNFGVSFCLFVLYPISLSETNHALNFHPQ